MLVRISLVTRSIFMFHSYVIITKLAVANQLFHIQPIDEGDIFCSLFFLLEILLYGFG